MNGLLVLLWVEFIVFFCLILFFHKLLKKKFKLNFVDYRSSLILSFFWIFSALLFVLFIWLTLIYYVNKEVANLIIMTFMSVYLLEKFLSIDNIFVWFMIFKYFSIPFLYQQKVLMYGVFGTLFFRIIIILFGIFILFKWKWISYVFSIFLLISGVQIIFLKEEKNIFLRTNKIIVLLYKLLRISSSIKKEKFFLKIDNSLFVTPLFIALIMIEISDLIFSIDSITAIFSITKDPFIIITANIFAIFGLRSIYFLFTIINTKINSMKYGLSLILIFVGLKTLVSDVLNISIQITVATILLIVIITVIYNIFINKKIKHK